MYRERPKPNLEAEACKEAGVCISVHDQMRSQMYSISHGTRHPGELTAVTVTTKGTGKKNKPVDLEAINTQA